MPVFCVNYYRFDFDICCCIKDNSLFCFLGSQNGVYFCIVGFHYTNGNFTQSYIDIIIIARHLARNDEKRFCRATGIFGPNIQIPFAVGGCQRKCFATHKAITCCGTHKVSSRKSIRCVSCLVSIFQAQVDVSGYIEGSAIVCGIGNAVLPLVGFPIQASDVGRWFIASGMGCDRLGSGRRCDGSHDTVIGWLGGRQSQCRSGIGGFGRTVFTVGRYFPSHAFIGI